MACMAPACVAVKAESSQTDTLLRNDKKVRAVRGSTEHTVDASVSGANLLVRIERSEQCRTTITPVFHRTVHTTRTIADGQRQALTPGTMALAGSGLALSSLWMTVDPDGFESVAGDSGGASEADNVALTTGVLGLGLLAIAIVDYVRLSDNTDDRGEVEGKSKTTAATCRRRRLANTQIAVRGRNSEFVAGAKTNQRGRAELSLFDLPINEFANEALELSLEANNVNLQVVLSRRDTRIVLSALKNDPSSRVSKELFAKAAKRCTESVAAASADIVTVATTEAAVAKATATWSELAQHCRPHWNSASQSAFEEFERRVEESRVERQVLACTQAAREAQHALESLSLDTLERISAARTHCSEVVDGELVMAKMTVLESQWEAAVLQAQRLEQQRLKKELRTQAREVSRERRRAAASQRRRRSRSSAPRVQRARSCCKFCSSGKPCGDSCISSRYTCHKGPGCAC